jgi:hypothetical protein
MRALPRNNHMPETLIESLDTAKDGVKAYLEDAAATRKVAPQSAKAMRLALFRFIADTLKITDKATRQAAWKQFDATPSWFGCNNSAGRQALGYKGDVEEMLEEIEA